jgi:ribosomal protein S18 acetylase RimI-like enzyme|tara:strand:- start:5994 stop:6497 length:504 start_codon:yes stop_codon:yes gene_type:complete
MEFRIVNHLDALAYREIHLEALLNSPESFGGNYRKEKKRPLRQIEMGLRADPNNFILGAFSRHKDLLGVVGFGRERHISYAQQGVLWGMYVKQAHRRQGIGRCLVKELLVLIQSLKGVEQFRLTVLENNDAAKQLYQQFGFVSQGVAERAFKLKNRYFDEEQMILYV